MDCVKCMLVVYIISAMRIGFHMLQIEHSIDKFNTIHMCSEVDSIMWVHLYVILQNLSIIQYVLQNV